MKTYVFDLLNRFQRKSDTLDIKALICNKSWKIFSDGEEKEMLLFLEDGTLVHSINGRALMGKWVYVPANHSLLLTLETGSLLVHPFFSNNILVLSVDGTNECSFLIDSTKEELAYISQFSTLTDYVLKDIDTAHSSELRLPNLPTFDSFGSLENRRTWGFSYGGQKKELVIETYKDRRDTFEVIRVEGQVISKKYPKIEDIDSWDNGFLIAVEKSLFYTSFIQASFNDFYFRDIPNLEVRRWSNGLLSTLFNSFWKDSIIEGYSKGDPIYSESWYKLGRPHNNEILSYRGLFKVVSEEYGARSTTIRIIKIRDVI